jgi:predicted DNA repair protein MutK
MLAVAGGILVHNIELVHHLYENSFHSIPSLIFDIVLGLVVGFVVLILMGFIDRFKIEKLGTKCKQ